MHALIATAAADEAFSSMCEAASLRGAAVHEITARESDGAPPIRLAVAGDRNAALGSAHLPGGRVIALGSALSRLGRTGDDGARHILDEFLKDDTRIERILTEDLIAIVSTHDGELVLLAGSGPHRLLLDSFDDTAIASNLLWLVCAGQGDRFQFDRSYEDFLLAHAFYPDGRTMAVNVRSMGPRSVARWTRHIGTEAESGTGTQRGKADVPVTTDDDERAVSKELYRLLNAAVCRQAGDTRQQAVLLGGLDSAIVAVLLSRNGYEVSTFTYRFEDGRHNQANVNLVTQAARADHNWVPITPEVIDRGLKAFGHVFSQPVAQPHYLLHALEACRIVRDAGFSHAFSGDNADAVLLGYPTVNQRAVLMARIARVPKPLRSAMHRALRPLVVDRLLGYSARRGRSVLEQAEHPDPVRGHLPTPILDEIALRRLRLEGERPQAEHVEDIRVRLAPLGLDAARLALDGHARVGQSRAKVEGAVAATGLAQSSPFNDPDVQRFTRALPWQLLRPAGTKAGDAGKVLLQHMAVEHRLLPGEVINQPKQSPTSAPIDSWYLGPLRESVLDLLQALPFEIDPVVLEAYLQPGWLDALMRRRIAGLSTHILHPVGLLASYGSLAAACRSMAIR